MGCTLVIPALGRLNQGYVSRSCLKKTNKTKPNTEEALQACRLTASLWSPGRSMLPSPARPHSRPLSPLASHLVWLLLRLLPARRWQQGVGGQSRREGESLYLYGTQLPPPPASRLPVPAAWALVLAALQQGPWGGCWPQQAEQGHSPRSGGRAQVAAGKWQIRFFSPPCGR